MTDTNVRKYPAIIKKHQPTIAIDNAISQQLFSGVNEVALNVQDRPAKSNIRQSQ